MPRLREWPWESHKWNKRAVPTCRNKKSRAPARFTADPRLGFRYPSLSTTRVADVEHLPTVRTMSVVTQFAGCRAFTLSNSAGARVRARALVSRPVAMAGAGKKPKGDDDKPRGFPRCGPARRQPHFFTTRGVTSCLRNAPSRAHSPLTRGQTRPARPERFSFPPRVTFPWSQRCLVSPSPSRPGCSDATSGIWISYRAPDSFDARRT